MEEVISFWLDLIKQYVTSLFSYQIVDGVSFGWFLIGCLVMSLVISFFFTRIVK